MDCRASSVAMVGTLSHRERILIYLTTPTEEKFRIDEKPLLYNMTLPSVVLEKQTKALRKLRKTPAQTQDVYEFLKSYRNIQSIQQFGQFLESEKGKSAPGSLERLPWERLERWQSMQGDRAESVFDSQLHRVHANTLGAKPFSFFFNKAQAEPCACEGGEGRYFDMLKKSILYHDEKEGYADKILSRTKLGQWFTYLLADSFPNRASVLTISGPKGTGKSTICNSLASFFNVSIDGVSYQKLYYFRLRTEEKGWPLDGISPFCVLLNMNDLVTDLPGLCGGAFLNLTERVGCFTAARKGATGIFLEKIPYITCTFNELKANKNFTSAQISAFSGSDGREYAGGILWLKALDEEQKKNASAITCAACAAKFWTWCQNNTDSNMGSAGDAGGAPASGEPGQAPENDSDPLDHFPEEWLYDH